MKKNTEIFCTHYKPLYIYIINNNKTTQIMNTQITIHPTVKAELESKFSEFGLSELFIKSYEGVYNLAFQDGYSLEEGHKIAMKALENLTKMITK